MDNATDNVAIPATGRISVVYKRPNDAGFIGKGSAEGRAGRLTFRGDRAKFLPANCCFLACLDPFFCSQVCCLGWLVNLMLLPIYLLGGLLLIKAQEYVIHLSAMESFAHLPGMLKLTYREGDRVKALSFKPANAEEGYQLLAWLEQELPGKRLT